MRISKHRIKILMAKQELTTKALAEKMNAQANNLSTILMRETCRPETVARIANALGVQLEEIVKED